MFHHFHVEDDVELFALIGQGLGGGRAVINVEAALGRVDFCHFDIGLRGIGADDLRAKAGHGLAQEAATAADIEKPQIVERFRSMGIASEMGRDMIADIGKADRVELVQNPEFSCRVPPFRREGREVLDFARVDSRLSSFGHGVACVSVAGLSLP
ncbi:hypothetical protein NA8A_21212 [Nitratireductor indicus C115]|uniref:Uncharacterized protein n=1 Tax=Nitratireductor indicus C115 TaxID=1231190 RepID=K2NRJ7_9HYPH|nr:hypothetical protein NA8A_21212 [Nitratireductor indicus C115]